MSEKITVASGLAFTDDTHSRAEGGCSAKCVVMWCNEKMRDNRVK